MPYLFQQKESCHCQSMLLMLAEVEMVLHLVNSKTTMATLLRLGLGQQTFVKLEEPKRVISLFKIALFSLRLLDVESGLTSVI